MSKRSPEIHQVLATLGYGDAIGHEVLGIQRVLRKAGFAPTGVLPVVPDFSHLDLEPNDLVAGQLDDEMTNIVFVGRIIPNKRIEDVIRYFHAYQRSFNPRSRLIFVGSYTGYDKYLAMLHELVADLGTSRVQFTGHVTDAELTAYYEVADLFLCASAHEGFCVPIMEAFYKQVPVVAYAATAVPATMDGAGVLYTTKDPLEVAAIVDAVLSDDVVCDAIVRKQNDALARLR